MTVQQYYDEIQTLFEEWKAKEPFSEIDHRDNVFIRDGIVCPEKWFTQSLRPLFLLKEAYGGTADWDLVGDHLLKNGKIKSGTWKRVTEWTRGLLGSDKTHIEPYVIDNSILYYGNSYLQQIAVVNVKKSGGTHGSNMETINKYAEYDKEQLYEEIKLIDPTLIICGYTISSLNIITGETVKDYQQQNTNLFYELCLNGHSVLVLDYYHPSNRYPDIMNYYGLMGIYQQALLQQGGNHHGIHV